MRQCIFVSMTLNSIGTWETTNSHICGMSFTGHTFTPAQVTQIYLPPYMVQPPKIYHTTDRGHMELQLVCIVPCGCAFHITLTITIIPPHTLLKPKLLQPISEVPSLVSTHFDLCSLTSSLRPDEAASVWKLQKLVFKKLIDLLCFSTQGDIITSCLRVNECLNYSHYISDFLFH